MPYAGPDSALFYEDVGRGDAIIFIPGFGGVGSFWGRQIEYFRDRFRIIAVDQRGTGKSARSRQEYSLDQMADDVQLVLDQAGIQSAILVGHSTGGVIAQILAARMPERVSNIVLSSTWCKPSKYFCRVFEFRRSLLELGEFDLFHKAGIFFRYPPDYSEKNDQAFENGKPVDIEITISRINAILQSDITSATNGIGVSALIVAARDDALVPEYMSSEVARNIAGSKYVVLNHGGHFLPETRSDEYNQIIDEFLTRASDHG